MKKFLIVLLILIIAFFAFCYYVGKNSSESESETTPGNLGNYDVTLVDYTISDEYDDGPVLLVTIKFTNYSSSPVSFKDVIGTNPYQNNVGLIGYHMYNEDHKALVRSGASIELVLGMELRDTTTPVDIDFGVKGGDKSTSITINIDKQNEQ